MGAYLSWSSKRKARLNLKQARRSKRASKSLRIGFGEECAVRRRTTPSIIEVRAKNYKLATCQQTCKEDCCSDLILDENVLEAVAQIQSSWDEDTRLLRAVGITVLPHGISKAEMLEYVQASAGMSARRVRLYPCDRRKFRHSFFTRGGTHPPRGHGVIDEYRMVLPYRISCRGIPPFVYYRTLN